MISGRCACGTVNVTIPGQPEYINICNCGLCRPTGAAWGYYETAVVQISGETRKFRRDDLNPAVVDLYFCPRCSSVTHYMLNENIDEERVGVNTRIFPQDALENVPVRYLDGRHVLTEEDEFIRSAEGRIGDGKAF